MDTKNINFKENKLHIFLIFLISLIISFSYNFLQYGIDGGLILANRISYPDQVSPMMYYFLNSWTAVHQVSYFIIKLGISVEIGSKILMFISTTFFSLGVYLISNSFSKNKNFSLFLTFVAILLGKNFGDTDYPSLIFSEHTYGMMSLAISTFVFGLIANKNLLLSGAFSMILISFHPVVGLWILFINLLSFFICDQINLDKKRFFKGLIIGVLILLISYFFFYYNSIEKTTYQASYLEDYLNYWDGHRIISNKIHYEYLVKTTLFIAVLCIFLKKLFKVHNEKYNFHIIVLLLSSVLSTIIYLIYKFFPNLFPQIIVLGMPSRFLTLHTFVGWPVIISASFALLIKKYYKKNLILYFYGFLCLLLLQNYEKIFNVPKNLFSTNIEKNNSEVLDFAKNENLNGYIITSSNLTSKIFKKIEKPILLHTDSMDFIPYHPYLANTFFEILQNVYGIERDRPPQKNNPSIPDKFIKKNFEKKTSNDWMKLKAKYNIVLILVPSTWEIDSKLILEDQFYKLFKIL